MTQDIVERLREKDYHDPACPFSVHCYCDDVGSHDRVTHPLAEEAADLIESLRAENGRLRKAQKDEAVIELVAMLSVATSEEGCTVFDHAPEEIGLHVMENHKVVLAALAAQQKGVG